MDGMLIEPRVAEPITATSFEDEPVLDGFTHVVRAADYAMEAVLREDLVLEEALAA